MIRRSAPLSRRTVLRGLLGAAGVSVALPALEVMLNSNGTALATGSPLPRRFGLFFWGNGSIPAAWMPEGVGPGWTPSPILQRLASITHLVSPITGFDLRVPNAVPHDSGSAGILSGAALRGEGDTYTFAQATIDQVIAAEIGGDTRFRSIEIGVRGTRGQSFNGPFNQNPPETSPIALFNRLFGDDFRQAGDDLPPDPRLALRRSVLDAVTDDIAALQQRVSVTDRARLDQHLTSVRELELRIARLEEDPPDLAACERPLPPLDAYPDVEGRPQLDAIHAAMIDLIAMSIACDQTRVFSEFYTDPVSDVLFPGASAGHHQLTHDEPGDQPECVDITAMCVGAYGDLVARLAEIPEGDGTILDRCLVLGTTDVSYGRTHALDDFPILVAGSADGRVRQGEHLRSEGDNASKVLLSIVRAMGITAPSFGAGDALATDGFSDWEL
jgi:hypothetical protein